jgi:hypothetical protein
MQEPFQEWIIIKLDVVLTGVAKKFKLGRIINTASKIVGSKQLSQADLFELALFRKGKQIMQCFQCFNQRRCVVKHFTRSFKSASD